MPALSPIPRLVAIAVLVLAVAGCASSKTGTTTIGPTEAWSQAAVTPIAQKLSRATSLLSEAVFNQSQEIGIPADFGVGEGSAKFIEDVQLIHEQATTLASQLEQGKGMADTIGVFERLEQATADAGKRGAEEFATTTVLTHFKNVEYLVGKLKPFYVGGK